jgi:homoserine kinase type II
MGGKPVDPLEKAAISAAGAWGLEAKDIRRDLAISGSPQRSEFRCVVECAHRGPVVLENIRWQDRKRKQAIIDRLDFLARQGLPGVHPYLQTSDGSHIIRIEDRHWQASPYIPGIPLDRPGYEFDRWRGEAMGDFLINLRKASRDLPDELSTLPFSILDYIEELMGRIRIREPGLARELAPVTTFLRKRLAPGHGLLPVAFCHGDFHPLNMIWSETAIQGVLDWEFSGTKPESFDAAGLIGCMGMETPDALTGELVTGFIRTLKTAQVFSAASRRVLVEMIIAIRFGWLSEWLRNRDQEMIELETVYMHLLTANADDLSTLWEIES